MERIIKALFLPDNARGDAAEGSPHARLGKQPVNKGGVCLQADGSAAIGAIRPQNPAGTSGAPHRGAERSHVCSVLSFSAHLLMDDVFPDNESSPSLELAPLMIMDFIMSPPVSRHPEQI